MFYENFENYVKIMANVILWQIMANVILWQIMASVIYGKCNLWQV